MRTPVFLLLILFIGEVYSNTPYLVYGNTTFTARLSNHGYLSLRSDSWYLVRWYTRERPCCGNRTWTAPNGSEVQDQFQDVASGYVVMNKPRGNNATDLEGIYNCTNLAGKSVYVGLYYNGGDVELQDLNFSVDYDLNGDWPQFTLACNSFGGPATIVTWTRNNVALTEENNTETVLNNQQTASYTHTLTVTEKEGGNYTCTVANAKPSLSSKCFSVKEDTNGYIINYSSGVSNASVTIYEVDTEYTLRNLLNGGIYFITVRATSEHFNSDSVSLPTVIHLVPDKPEVFLESTSTNCLTVSFSIGSDSVFNNLKVKWISLQCPDYVDEGYDTFSWSHLLNHRNICFLRVGTTYDVSATVTNSAGTSESSRVITETTQELRPSAPPSSLHVSGVTTSNMTVEWGPVECIYRNGHIAYYSLTYREMDSGIVQDISVSGNGNGGVYTIFGLAVSTVYTLAVAAENSEGIGPYSEPVNVTTLASVYLSLRGVIIPDNGYLLISDIGSTEDDSLICHTSSESGGHWLSPNSSEIFQGFNISHDSMVVRLHRMTAADQHGSGIYTCVGSSNETVYVGLYGDGGGAIAVSEPMNLTLLSDARASPAFYLTCISIGGPATTVAWTRDSHTVTEGTETVLVDPMSGQYVHTLIGTHEGVYTCSVSNAISSVASLILNVQAPTSPTIVNVIQRGFRSVELSWMTQDVVTGFVIFYWQEGEGVYHSDSVNAEDTDRQIVIPSLTMGYTYYISMVATSNTLPSMETTAISLFIEITNISLTSHPSSSIVAGDSLILKCSVSLPPEVDGSPVFQLVGPQFVHTRFDNNSGIGYQFSKFRLYKMRTSQSGLYSCRATLNGSIFAYISIHVEIPLPAIAISLNHLTPLYSSTNLILTCNATMSPYLDSGESISAVWTCPEGIDCDEKNTLTEFSGSGLANQLIISPLAQYHSGTYMCTATITGKTIIVGLNAVILNVNDLPSPSVSSSSGVPLMKQPYLLICSLKIVSELVEEPEIQWISQDGRVMNSSTGTSLHLYFNPLKKSDSGLYTCRAIIRIIGLAPFSAEAVHEILLDIPSGSPLMFEVLAEQRLVNFSWSPPPPSQQNGIITNYSLSCSPSPSSLPLSFSQSGSYIVGGFTPDTGYTCSVVASNGLGSGPPASKQFSMQPDYSSFELCLSGDVSCCNLMIAAGELNMKVANAILFNFTSSCNECGITVDVIDMQTFTCYPGSPTIVTYQARVGGTAEAYSLSLSTLIDEWIDGGDNITVMGVNMKVDIKCLQTVMPEDDCFSVEQSDLYTAVSASGGVVVAILFCAVIVAVLRRRHQRVKNKSSLEMEQFSSPIKSDTSPATEERVYAIIGQEEPGSKPPEVAYENVATRRHHFQPEAKGEAEERMYHEVNRGNQNPANTIYSYVEIPIIRMTKSSDSQPFKSDSIETAPNEAYEVFKQGGNSYQAGEHEYGKPISMSARMKMGARNKPTIILPSGDSVSSNVEQSPGATPRLSTSSTQLPRLCSKTDLDQSIFSSLRKNRAMFNATSQKQSSSQSKITSRPQIQPKPTSHYPVEQPFSGQPSSMAPSLKNTSHCAKQPNDHPLPGSKSIDKSHTMAPTAASVSSKTCLVQEK